MVTINPTAFVHETVVLGPNVLIEDGVYIGPYCIIGLPAEWKGKESEPCKGVRICKGARLTGLVTVDAGVEQRTTIGANAYLMKHSHIGHDAVVMEGATISCGAKIGGHAIVGADSNIGLNAVIHQRQAIQQGCMVGMGSVVTKKLETEPFKTYAGNPARLIGENTNHPKYPK